MSTEELGLNHLVFKHACRVEIILIGQLPITLQLGLIRDGAHGFAAKLLHWPHVLIAYQVLHRSVSWVHQHFRANALSESIYEVGLPRSTTIPFPQRGVVETDAGLSKVSVDLACCKVARWDVAVAGTLFF